MLASQRAVLFLCTDITSHMLGLLPVVQELTARGIAVPTFIVANTSDITAEHTRLLEAAGAALLNAQHRFEVPPPPTVPSAAALLVGMLWRAQYTVPVVLAAVAAAQWVPGAVLYDHFAIEGFIVAKVLRLLGVVHLAVLRWAPMERAAYRAALRCDAFREANGRLAERHGVDVVRETGLGNFGHCGDLNFLWTSPALAGGLRWLHECLATWAPPGALTPPPTLDRFLFLGAAESPPLVAADPALEEALTAACARGQRVVLLAFGTLVMGQYYDAVGAAAREFFRDFFAALARAVAEARDLFVVVATGRTDPCDVFGRDAPPANLWHQRTVPQPQVLAHAAAFVTHGGAKSVAEGVARGVPLVLVPFFGDQHQAAAVAQALGCGRAFLHPPDVEERALDPLSGLYARPGLSAGAVLEAVRDVAGSARFQGACREAAEGLAASAASGGAKEVVNRIQRHLPAGAAQ